MSEDTTYFADLLADKGYYVLAPDLFRNVASEEDNLVWNLWNVISTPQSRLDLDADAAFAYLLSISAVDKNRVASGPGFCFGGSQALLFAARHRMAASVTLYGSVIDDLHDAGSDAWGAIDESVPVLGIYGAEDTLISTESVQKFEAAMEQKGMSYNVTIYDNVGHAFVHKRAHEGDSRTANISWMCAHCCRSLGRGPSAGRRGLAADRALPATCLRYATLISALSVICFSGVAAVPKAMDAIPLRSCTRNWLLAGLHACGRGKTWCKR